MLSDGHSLGRGRHEVFDDDDDELWYDDKSVKYNEDKDERDEVSRVVNERTILLLVTI